jgi:hypothetical protein
MALDTQLLRDFCQKGTLSFRVRDECMTPVIFEGENVIVTSCRIYWPGDILVFHQGDARLRIHRLIAYRLKGRSLQLLTRGDRLESFDAPIHLDQVIGKVKAVASRDGRRNSLRRIWPLARGVMDLGRMTAHLLASRIRRVCSAQNT